MFKWIKKCKGKLESPNLVNHNQVPVNCESLQNNFYPVHIL